MPQRKSPLLEGMDRDARRLQILFRRKGKEGYSEVAEVRLERDGTPLYADEHRGYCGSFNRLNVYTLGDVHPFSLKESRLVVRCRACAHMPLGSQKTEKVQDSIMEWAIRLV